MIKLDLYQTVTDRIVAEIEGGCAPWLKGWDSTGAKGGAMPHNAISGKAYRGVNTLLLMGAAAQFGNNSFCTFKQALDMGGHVRKGEHGFQVVFWKIAKVGANDSSPDDEKLIPFARLYTVFNVTQCDGLKIPGHKPARIINPETRDATIDAYIAKTGADIRHGGNDAYYARGLSHDFVQLPEFAQFHGANHYYATAFHELTHWTSHATRCNRELGKRFGSDAYAAEELIAELGAAFLCAGYGVTGELRHAAYLANWLKVLKADKRAIFTAASKAQQAADYLALAFEAEQQIAA